MFRDKTSCILPSQIGFIVFITTQKLTSLLSSKLQTRALSHSVTLSSYVVKCQNKSVGIQKMLSLFLVIVENL